MNPIIKSMTGYGRSQQTLGNYDITAELKSVNHRYADYNIRVPRSYGFLEEKIRNHLQQHIARGKTEVYVSVYKQVDDTKQVSLNVPLAQSYVNALRTLADEFDLQDDIGVSTVARYTDLFDTKHAPEDEEALLSCVLTVLDAALQDFLDMRMREGEKMAADMVMRNDLVRQELLRIEQIAPGTVVEQRQKIEERIRELLGDAPVDENRLLTEAAIYADKLSITEEIVRLHSHLDEFDRIVQAGGAVGRKLDFLLQEMNRETNTIGSKANNLDIAKIVVTIKAELEKIREQVQNIE